MELSKNYTDSATELIGSLFTLPTALQDITTTDMEIKGAITEFDSLINAVRKQLINLVVHNKYALYAITQTNTDHNWQKTIAQIFSDFEEEKYEHLLSEPNIFFSMYLQQEEFPYDGFNRLFDFFQKGLDKEIYELKIPLRKLTFSTDSYECILKDLDDTNIGNPDGCNRCANFILYLYTFFPKEITIYLENLNKSENEFELSLERTARNKIENSIKNQTKLFF